MITEIGIFATILLTLHSKEDNEMKTNKISLLGKVIVIFSCIMMIVMVLGKWLDLYQIPMIFGNSIPHEYSLFEISDFMDTFNMYLENETIQVYSTLLSVGAVAAIVLSVITIITALVNNSLSNVSSAILMIVNVLLAGVFVGTIIYVNGEMEEATYGGIKELLRGTSKPYFMIAFSILNIIGVRLKCKIQPSTETNKKADIKYNCTGCGAELPAGTKFCTHCGKKADDIQDTYQEKFCTSCGAKIDPNMTFCVSCGAKVDINEN